LSHFRHAGIHWPANAGGEHPDRETIYRMPGIQFGCTTMCADSARYWYNEARESCPTVLWRGLPRPGMEPARLGWNAGRVATECLNLWDERVHSGRELYTPLNEVNLPKELGGEFPGFASTAAHLESLRLVLRGYLPPSVDLVYPAWSPSDPWRDDAHWDEWTGFAERWDIIGLHAYGTPEEILARYRAYRAKFPRHRIILKEWNGPDEAGALEVLAKLAAEDPLFLGATYYIWETNNAGENGLSVWGNEARFDLFLRPPEVPAVEPGEDPVTVSIPNPWRFWTAEAIASILECPLESVRANWPRINEQFWRCGLTDLNTMAAAAATVAVETAHRFEPIHEFRNADGSIPSWWYTYDGGPQYHGRGFTQNTHRYQYEALSTKIPELWGTSPDQPDFDFVNNPDGLLDPDISAAAMAIFFRDKRSPDGDSIPAAANRGDWRAARQLVQGASAGLEEFQGYAVALGGHPPIEVGAGELMYGPNVPDEVILQQNNWSCAVRSTYAALWAMASLGQAEGVTYGDDGPRDVYNWLVPKWDQPGVGLLDHTGAGLAEALRSLGYRATNIYPTTITRAREHAGTRAVLLGGDAWNHWVYIRGRTADGGLVVENPSPGHMGISDYIRDSWARLGPMALVVVDPPEDMPTQPSQPISYEDALNLVGNAFNEDGVVVPALVAAVAGGDWGGVEAVIKWLRENRK
jgi:hypothetical protein